MSGFVIKKGPQEHVIEDGSLDTFFDRETRDTCLTIPAGRQPDASAAVLYLLPSAFLELDAHIHWKIRTWSNTHEQGGLMIGDVYRDLNTKRICGVVQHIISSENAGNATYLQFTHEDWSQMLITYEERFPQQEGGQRPRIIGWYHTHPNMPTHMSQIDKHTHRSFWGKEWQFSAILNPQWGMWEVFNGEECGNCCGVLYYDRQWIPQAPPERRESATPLPEVLGPVPGLECQGPAVSSPETLEPVPGSEHQEPVVSPPEALKPVPGSERQEPVVSSPEALKPDPGSERQEPAVSPPEALGSDPGSERAPDPAHQKEGSPSTGVFIIKRAPEHDPWPHAPQRTWYTMPPSAPSYFRCKSWILNNEYYFLPYHSTDANIQYLISWRLVQNVWQLAKCRSFPTGVSVSLTCQVEVSRTFLCQDSLNRGYRELQCNGRIYAEGFEYETGQSGSLQFRETRGSSYVNDKSLTALFSETLPDYPILREKYRDSHFLLWYNPKAPLDFLFFNIWESRGIGQRTTGFQIKNRPMQEPIRLPKPTTLHGAELFEQWFVGRQYITAESCSTSTSLRQRRKISSDLLRVILSYLRGYTAMTERFCVAVGYEDEGARGHVGSSVLPHLPYISELKFFVEEDLYGRFNNFDSQMIERPSHFLFVLANYEVDSSWLKTNMRGCSTAFCVNLSNRSYRFYHMR